MANRPNTYLNWTDGAPSKVIQPPAPILNQGWFAGEAPPAEYTNWQIWLADQWIQYLDSVIEPGQPDQVIRLLDGGFWSFNASTGVLAWSLDAKLAFAGVPDGNNTIPAGNATLTDGQVAYVNVNAPIITNGNTQSGIAAITSLNFVGNLTIGMTVTGPGIPGGTTVLGVGPDNVTISNPATSTNTAATYIFSETAPLAVVVVDNTAFIPSFETIMIARREGEKIYLGVNTGQMLIRDHEYKPLLASGYFDTYEAPAGEALTAGQLVYLSPGSAGGDAGRTAGALYKLDVSASNEAVRGTFAGVVISDVLATHVATVLYNGFYKYSSLIPGVDYFADPAVPGGFTTPQPSGAGQKIVPIGFAVTATSMIVTSANGVGGSFTQPVLQSETFGAGNGVQTTFPLSTFPINDKGLFVFVDGGILPNSQWSLSGKNITFTTAPAVGVQLYAQYVLAQQAYLIGFQEIPTGVIDGVNTTFGLDFEPQNQNSVFVYVNGDILPNDQWSLTIGVGSSTVNLATPPPIGSDVYVAGLSPVGSFGGNAVVTGGLNLGSGITIFKALVSGTMQFKTLVAGTGIAITQDLIGNVTITNTGGGGGGGVTVYGSIASPQIFAPSSGLVPGPEMDQLWFIKTSGGQQDVTAIPQIADGTTVGQRLTLRGVDASNYYTFRGTAGAYVDGLSLNGSCNINNNESLRLYWDGTGWYEDSRRL